MKKKEARIIHVEIVSNCSGKKIKTLIGFNFPIFDYLRLSFVKNCFFFSYIIVRPISGKRDIQALRQFSFAELFSMRKRVV